MANTNSLDLELDSSQYAGISDATQTGLDITGDITIEAWIKVESTPAAGVYYPIVTKGHTSTKRGYYFEYHKSGGGTERLGCLISDNGSSVSEHYKSFAPTTGVWYHVAMTYDVSAGTAEFFVNGSTLGTVASGKTSIFDNDGEFHIGENEGAYFDGLVDEVRVWNDIRTSGEISANYQTELVGDEANLVGYWKFNNNYLDETTNNNDLTSSGSPVFSTDVPFTGATTRVHNLGTLGVGA